MPGYCILKTCKNSRTRPESKGVTYHALPKNPDVRKLWISNLNIEDYTLKHDQLTICSSHFERKCFFSGRSSSLGTSKIFLRNGSIPTIIHPVEELRPLELLEKGLLPALVIKSKKLHKFNQLNHKRRKKIKTSNSQMSKTQMVAKTFSDAIKGIQQNIYSEDEKLRDTDTFQLSSIIPLLTCKICKGYFVNATTITECLHTFCRSCIVKHVTESLYCPFCKKLIHPSDPFVNLRLDSMWQDLVNKAVPEFDAQERNRHDLFYRSRNLPIPGQTPKSDKKISGGLRWKKIPKLPPDAVNIHLEYAGSAKGCGKYDPLEKKFVRVSSSVTISKIEKFIRRQLSVPELYHVGIFLDNYILHSSLSLDDVFWLFPCDDLKNLQDILNLQYGILPDGDYFQTETSQNCISSKPCQKTKRQVPCRRTSQKKNSIISKSDKTTQGTEAVNEPEETPLNKICQKINSTEIITNTDEPNDKNFNQNCNKESFCDIYESCLNLSQNYEESFHLDDSTSPPYYDIAPEEVDTDGYAAEFLT